MPRLHARLRTLLDRSAARRAIALAIGLWFAACLTPGPKRNQVLGRLPKHSWHGPVGEASYCTHCTHAGLITIDLGSHAQLTTTICFKHAKTKIGITQFDSHVEVEEDGSEVVAIDGLMEIESCSPKHITATLWAQFPDGGRVEASIDSALTEATIVE